MISQPSGPGVAALPRSEPRGWGGLSRYLFCGGFAGLLAGIIFLGAGSRVVMRLSFILDPQAEGALTENGNIVGEFTLGGTLGLLIFNGIFGGLIAGLLWVLIREWLPLRTVPRLVLAGVVAALLGSFMVISAENRDFFILQAPAANIAMFIVIVGLTGSGTAAIDAWLQRVLPDGRRITLLYGVLVVLGAALSVPLLAQAFLVEDFCGCKDPPRLAAPFIMLAAAATLEKWAGFTATSPGVEPRRLKYLGITGVVGACIFAGADLLAEVREIL